MLDTADFQDPIKVLQKRLEAMPLEEEDDDFTNGADMLQVFGGHMDMGGAVADAVPSSPASSDMSLDSSSDDSPEVVVDITPDTSVERASVAIKHNPRPPSPPSPGGPPPPPPDTPPLPSSPPPPPPPSDEPPPPPPLQPVRWALYDTDLFDSDRLVAFTTARPLPLGY